MGNKIKGNTTLYTITVNDVSEGEIAKILKKHKIIKKVIDIRDGNLLAQSSKDSVLNDRDMLSYYIQDCYNKTYINKKELESNLYERHNFVNKIKNYIEENDFDFEMWNNACILGERDDSIPFAEFLTLLLKQNCNDYRFKVFRILGYNKEEEI